MQILEQIFKEEFEKVLERSKSEIVRGIGETDEELRKRLIENARKKENEI